MANANGILNQMERKQALSSMAPERHTTMQRAAEALSRRNADAAIVELFMEACQRLTLLAYEQDSDGYYNIDPVTWRLLIPAPWGRSGHRRWGITSTESVILRQMMQTRQAQTPNRPPGLWLYDSSRRQWRLNLFDFDTLTDGQRYWTRWPLSVAEYRAAHAKRLAR